MCSKAEELVLVLIVVCAGGYCSAEIPASCEIRHFQQRVDHFDFQNSKTFAQRYVFCGERFGNGGPIFFYTGNEGDILVFANNTGFMFDLTDDFAALVVFAEHRYYGESVLPGTK